MRLFRRIVAPVGDAADENLLQYAAMVCRLAPEAEIDAIHVVPRQGNAPAPQERWQAMCAHCREDCGRSIRFHVRRGDLTDEVLRFALERRAELIVVGGSRQRHARRSLARRLAMKAPCSVWVAPRDAPAKLQKVLVPIDFSARAADALKVATVIAARAGIEECDALHVYYNQADATYDEYDEIIRADAAGAFHIFVSRIDLSGVDVRPRFVEAAQVGPAIEGVAEEIGADLIVMGTRGRSRSAAVLLGSETDHMIRHSAAPVLAVKHFGARMRLVQALLDRRFAERGVRFS
jgi:nucleotide-binding universal stress UspA family protein